MGDRSPGLCTVPCQTRPLKSLFPDKLIHENKLPKWLASREAEGGGELWLAGCCGLWGPCQRNAVQHSPQNLTLSALMSPCGRGTGLFRGVSPSVRGHQSFCNGSPGSPCWWMFPQKILCIHEQFFFSWKEKNQIVLFLIRKAFEAGKCAIFSYAN